MTIAVRNHRTSEQRVRAKRCVANHAFWQRLTGFVSGWFLLLGPAAVSLQAQSLSSDYPPVPYEAVIDNRAATIHSGPGDSHYITDRLGTGEVVIVYRHDPDGWLAIRPPQGSFSLVPESAITPTGHDGIVQVVEEGVKAWVGTRLDSPELPLSQVRLRLGERLKVIGEQTASYDSRTPVRWLRVSPPDGEFRWIHETSVTIYRPTNVSSSEGPSSIVGHEPTSQRDTNSIGSNSLRAPPRSNHPVVARDGQADSVQRIPTSIEHPGDEIALTGETQAEQGDDAEAANEARSDQPFNDGFVARTGESTLDNTNAVADPVIDYGMPVNDRFETAFQDEIRRVEHYLTQMVILPVEQWDTSVARSVAEALEHQEPNPSQRVRLRRLYRKLDAFDEYQTTVLAAAAIERPIDVTIDTNEERSLVGDRTILDSMIRPTAATEPVDDNYAASGVLNRLITERGLGRGGYVLQDPNGRILSVVAPAPGLNLERYLEQEVGLQGVSTSHAQYEVPFILADRVVLLERHR